MTEPILPPHSTEAEQFLLGALMLDSRLWDKISGKLSDSDFYRDDHRRIFRHIARIAEHAGETDILSVFDSIERAKEVEQTGGLAYLGDLANATPGGAGIVHHAEIIVEKSKLRRLVKLGDELAARSLSPGTATSGDLISDAERMLAAEDDSTSSDPVSLQTAMAEAMEYVDSRNEKGGLLTLIEGFDKLTGGLEPGQLIIIAARPSVGKTALACQIADAIAQPDSHVLFHTLEMTKRDIGMRILAERASVPVHRMRSGTNSKDDWAQMSSALSVSTGSGLWIDDSPAITVGQVRAKARRLKRTRGLSAIVIDYLGLMTGTGDNRTQELGSISRGLKALAKELRVPIIALAQLNRGVEARTDKRPLMSDLRDSGEIEQDADIVAMLHRQELYDDGVQWQGFAELLVRKNRNGPLGTVELRFDGKMMSFSPWYGASPRLMMDNTRRKGFSGD